MPSNPPAPANLVLPQATPAPRASNPNLGLYARKSIDDRLVAFLYVLMRDELAPQTVARLLVEHTRRIPPGDKALFSNPELEGLAREIAAELVPSSFSSYGRPENKLSTQLIEILKVLDKPQGRGQCSCACHTPKYGSILACGTKTNMLHEPCC